VGRAAPSRSDNWIASHPVRWLAIAILLGTLVTIVGGVALTAGQHIPAAGEIALIVAMFTAVAVGGLIGARRRGMHRT